MSAIINPKFDGLCGVPCSASLWSPNVLRCRFEFDHLGHHSWKRYESQFVIVGGVWHHELLWALRKPLNPPKKLTVLNHASYQRLVARHPELSLTLVETTWLPRLVGSRRTWKNVRVNDLPTNWYVKATRR